MLRGRFGDTRVEPARLFDVGAGGGPPAGAVDVQFRAPLTFSLLVDDLLAAGRELDARTCFQLYEQVIEKTVAELQFSCGYVRDGADLVPARLEVAALGESDVPGMAEVRMHHHIWVGATAITLDDGVRRPVDQRRLQRGAEDVVFQNYYVELKHVTEEVLGVRWGRPRPHAATQIVDPPLHERLAGRELGHCPSPWPGAQVYEHPTQEWLDSEAADVAAAERRIADGTAWKAPGRVLDL